MVIPEQHSKRKNWTFYWKICNNDLRLGDLLKGSPFYSQNRSLQRSRKDDTPEIIERRIQLFEERTVPILEYYSFRDRLLEVNGNQSPQQVQQDILKVLGHEM
jgi:adenylate kinase family enzyme